MEKMAVTGSNIPVYREVCSNCGKEIVSLSKGQAAWNFKLHKVSCKKNEKLKK